MSTTLLEVPTAVGLGRWHLDLPAASSRLTLALGHGAGGGVESADLALLASSLPKVGVAVARFEQPWRVAGRRVAGPPSQLDRAWLDALDALDAVPSASGLRFVGGRSAGARVACRTASRSSVAGVLALAFPLHPPGAPARSRADELPGLPLLVIQGTRDPFGTAAEVGAVLDPARHRAVAVAGADHSLRVARTAPITQAEADETIVLAVSRWLRDTAKGNAPGDRVR